MRLKHLTGCSATYNAATHPQSASSLLVIQGGKTPAKSPSYTHKTTKTVTQVGG